MGRGLSGGLGDEAGVKLACSGTAANREIQIMAEYR
jgi:hypothetical protein